MFFYILLFVFNIILTNVTYANTSYTIHNADIDSSLAPTGLPGGFSFYSSDPDEFFYIHDNEPGNFVFTPSPFGSKPLGFASGVFYTNDAMGGFNFEFLFVNFTLPNDPEYEVSTHLELLPSAYVTNGGLVDPFSWSYFDFAVGTLSGFGSKNNESYFWQSTMAPPQFGLGANGKNGNLGMSSWGLLIEDTDLTIKRSDINWNLQVATVPLPSTLYLFLSCLLLVFVLKYKF